MDFFNMSLRRTVDQQNKNDLKLPDILHTQPDNQNFLLNNLKFYK